VKYALEHTTIDLNYFHGITGGGGVLLGSTMDQGMATLSRQMGRVWTAYIDFGYARNSAFAVGPGTPTQTFDDWFAGGGISRQFGRNVSFAVSYSPRFETTSPSLCTSGTGTNCSSSYTQHLVSVSLQWHTRPFVLR
jgi:hypothetical protein